MRETHVCGLRINITLVVDIARSKYALACECMFVKEKDITIYSHVLVFQKHLVILVLNRAKCTRN
jgi:hypothetical protein